jgi:GTP-binding protein
MQSFVDEATVEVVSGNGGQGSVHFRREKYVPKGGPDGGDGGRGGDVVFLVKDNLKTLFHLKTKHVFKAKNGNPGGGKRKHGGDGEDVEIPVPPGTIIKDGKTGEILKDLDGTEERWVFLEGGKGGLGNYHFRTSKNQTPRYAQPGIPGKRAAITVELRIIADIGFVGFPNAGKSTLLRTLSNANPKIGSYPFTTKIPNLGVLKLPYRDIVLADIPGLIEGASGGAGLGHRFLKHITRTRGLAFLIDCSEENFAEQFEILEKELSEYLPVLLEKKRILLGTKMDSGGADSRLQTLRQRYPDEKVIGVSAFSFEGIPELKEEFSRLAEGCL